MLKMCFEFGVLLLVMKVSAGIYRKAISWSEVAALESINSKNYQQERMKRDQIYNEFLL